MFWRFVLEPPTAGCCGTFLQGRTQMGRLNIFNPFDAFIVMARSDGHAELARSLLRHRTRGSKTAKKRRKKIVSRVSKKGAKRHGR